MAQQDQILRPSGSSNLVIPSLSVCPPGSQFSHLETSANVCRLCHFHLSPLFNSVQHELWERISQAIYNGLSQHSTEFLLPIADYLGHMAELLEKNFIPIFEEDEWDTELFEMTLPKYTPCIGSFLYLNNGINSRLSYDVALLLALLARSLCSTVRCQVK